MRPLSEPLQDETHLYFCLSFSSLRGLEVKEMLMVRALVLADLHLDMWNAAGLDPFKGLCQRQSKIGPKGSAKCCHFEGGVMSVR
ncbi:hypothetical protein, partial [Tropicibacter alexandrii]|uniref:hypothetical protein n=1 Tax=Tropicibacter alexandrii TaxID=2267683 RepID=UPI00197E05CE